MVQRKEVRELIQKAELLGFIVDRELSGKGHITLVHPNGQHTIANTPSDWRSEKNAISHLERIAGKKLPRVGHRRSRKSVKGTDFSIEKAHRERNDRAGETIDRLMDEHAHLIEKFKYYAKDGEGSSRTNINKCIEIVRRLGEIEVVLKEFHQPIDSFNPQDVL